MRELRHVALIVETSSAYGRGLLRGIAEYARLHGPWSFFVEPGMPASPVLRLRGWRVEGVIVALNHLRRPETRLAFPGIPMLDLDHMAPHSFPRGICNDETAVGRVAAEHLLACGMRDFAFCGWGPADPACSFWETARAEAFMATLRDQGRDPAVYCWPRREGDWTWAREQKHLARWLRSLPKPVGVMASNDQRGRHVLEAARLAGVRVPEEMAVVGVDNDEVTCELCSPPLSSVVLNNRRLGFEAAAFLDRQMSRLRKTALPVLIAPGGVASRRSTDLLAVDDPAVSIALQLVRANVAHPLQVADLQRAAGVSRRSLELRFRRAVGWSPHDEIERVRLTRLKELLVGTDWPLKSVSAAAGFSRPEHMHAVFRRATGLTPTRYRTVHRQ